MPKVPVSDNVVPLAAPGAAPAQGPTNAQMLMAAALMHSEGKLFTKDKDDSGK